MIATSQTLGLPYPTLPLRSNHRHHWHTRARITAEIRGQSAWIAKAALRPVVGPVTVTLLWCVTDKRIRDAGAGAPTLKAVIDGLVDAGVLPADDDSVVVAETYRVVRGTYRGVRVLIEAAS